METSRVSGGSPAPEPTASELEAGASLLQEPERLESRDAHYFEGNTSERWSLSLDQIKDAVRRFADLPGVRRFGL